MTCSLGSFVVIAAERVFLETPGQTRTSIGMEWWLLGVFMLIACLLVGWSISIRAWGDPRSQKPDERAFRAAANALGLGARPQRELLLASRAAGISPIAAIFSRATFERIIRGRVPEVLAAELSSKLFTSR